jgi:hypothetical protein
MKKVIESINNILNDDPATRMSAKTMIIPYLSIDSIPRLTNSGARAYKTLEPSSGGIGIKLKIKKPRLTITPTVNIRPSIPITVPEAFTGFPIKTDSP